MILGRGLAMRWASAGHPVIVGSRDAERARAAAEALLSQAPRSSVTGTDNRTSAERYKTEAPGIRFTGIPDGPLSAGEA
jgi:predicted dinucleotide-binding enzyme